MEFSTDVEKVKSWSIKKLMEHSFFLELYYKKKYGDGSGENNNEYSQGVIDKMPPEIKKYMPKTAGSRTTGHTFQFR